MNTPEKPIALTFHAFQQKRSLLSYFLLDYNYFGMDSLAFYKADDNGNDVKTAVNVSFI